METIIGSTNEKGAKLLFATPEVDGETFRKNVDIYAAGTPRIAETLVPGYAKKLRKKKEEKYIVFARSFMKMGEKKPEEKFDISFCVPVDAITDEMIDQYEHMLAARYGAGPCGGPKGPHPHGGHGHGGPKK